MSRDIDSNWKKKCTYKTQIAISNAPAKDLNQKSDIYLEIHVKNNGQEWKFVSIVEPNTLDAMFDLNFIFSQTRNNEWYLSVDHQSHVELDSNTSSIRFQLSEDFQKTKGISIEKKLSCVIHVMDKDTIPFNCYPVKDDFIGQTKRLFLADLLNLEKNLNDSEDDEDNQKQFETETEVKYLSRTPAQRYTMKKVSHKEINGKTVPTGEYRLFDGDVGGPPIKGRKNKNENTILKFDVMSFNKEYQ